MVADVVMRAVVVMPLKNLDRALILRVHIVWCFSVEVKMVAVRDPYGFKALVTGRKRNRNTYRSCDLLESSPM